MPDNEKIAVASNEPKKPESRTGKLSKVIQKALGLGWPLAVGLLAVDGMYSVIQEVKGVRDVNEHRIFQAVENEASSGGVRLEQSQPGSVDPSLCRVLFQDTTSRSDDKDVLHFELGGETITFDRRWVAAPGMIRRGGEISLCGKIGEPGKEVVVFVDTGRDDIDWDKRDALQAFGQPNEPLAKFDTKSYDEKVRDDRSIRLVVVRNPETFFDPYQYEKNLGDSYVVDLQDLVPEINKRTNESVFSFSSVSQVENSLWTVAHTQGDNFNILVDLTFGGDGLPVIATKHVLEYSASESAGHYVRSSFGAEGSLYQEVVPQSLIWPDLMSEQGYQELATYFIKTEAEKIEVSDEMKMRDGYYDTNEKTLFLDHAYAITRVIPVAEDGANVPKAETRFLGEIVEGNIRQAFLLPISTPQNMVSFVDSTAEVALVTLSDAGQLNKFVFDDLQKYVNRDDVTFSSSVGTDKRIRIDVRDGETRKVLASIGTEPILDATGAINADVGAHLLPLPHDLELIE